MLEKRSTDNFVSNKNMELKDYIATIENYPKEGVVFRDISPLMADGNAYNYAATEIVQYARDKEIDMVVGPEARGFIIGCPVAFALDAEMVVGLAGQTTVAVVRFEQRLGQFDARRDAVNIHLFDRQRFILLDIGLAGQFLLSFG